MYVKFQFESAPLPVLRIVEFFNRDFNVKLQSFALRFLKKNPLVFYRISNITGECHALERK